MPVFHCPDCDYSFEEDISKTAVTAVCKGECQSDSDVRTRKKFAVSGES